MSLQVWFASTETSVEDGNDSEPHLCCRQQTQDEKQKDIELALNLAKNHPELFEVAHEYEFTDFPKAIQHASRPGKTGIVLLKSPS